MKKITLKTEYITLGQLLKFISVIQSGGEAKIWLQLNEVLVNGNLETRRGRKLYPDDWVMIESERYVMVKDET